MLVESQDMFADWAFKFSADDAAVLLNLHERGIFTADEAIEIVEEFRITSEVN